VIAAINGFALGGGCELALACDLRVAAESVKLGQPEVRYGIIPSAGTTQKLPRIVGIRRAKKLILTGDVISANEAFTIGLVNRVVSYDRLMEETHKLAKKFYQKIQ
jgi:enoyl-CoA hydratase